MASEEKGARGSFEKQMPVPTGENQMTSPPSLIYCTAGDMFLFEISPFQHSFCFL